MTETIEGSLISLAVTGQRISKSLRVVTQGAFDHIASRDHKQAVRTNPLAKYASDEKRSLLI
jgi:hypothetical protein